MGESRIAARERIIEAALVRVAIEGVGASLRSIATAAGVSAGLIIHHFGSRDGLLEACDEHCLAVTRDSKTDVVRGDAGVMLAQLAEAEQYAPVVGFVLRRLQAGGDVAAAFVDEFAQETADYLEEGVRLGSITPSRDPLARARLLTEMGLGALLLQLPARGAPLSIEELPAWMRRYTERIIGPSLELYTEPLLASREWFDGYLASHPAGGGAESSDRSAPASADSAGESAGDDRDPTTPDHDRSDERGRP